MKEHQVDTIPFSSYSQALLSGDERKIAAEFQQELLKTLDDGTLELRFRVLILQVQEFENKRVSHVSVGRQALIFGRGRCCATGSLVSQTRNLAVQLPN